MGKNDKKSQNAKNNFEIYNFINIYSQIITYFSFFNEFFATLPLNFGIFSLQNFLARGPLARGSDFQPEAG